MLHKTLIALAAAAALGCVPVATNALASSHPGNYASARHGPIYDSCPGYGTGYSYGYGGCPGYGGVVGGLIGGVQGGYGPR